MNSWRLIRIKSHSLIIGYHFLGPIRLMSEGNIHSWQVFHLIFKADNLSTPQSHTNDSNWALWGAFPWWYSSVCGLVRYGICGRLTEAQVIHEGVWWKLGLTDVVAEEVTAEESWSGVCRRGCGSARWKRWWKQNWLLQTANAFMLVSCHCAASTGPAWLLLVPVHEPDMC